MSPNERSPTLATSGSEECDLAAGSISRSYSHTDLAAQADALAVIADWKDDLRARIARTQLIFEFADTDVDFVQLADEVATFKRVCACLSWRAP